MRGSRLLESLDVTESAGCVIQAEARIGTSLLSPFNQMRVGLPQRLKKPPVLRRLGLHYDRRLSAFAIKFPAIFANPDRLFVFLHNLYRLDQ